MHPLKLAVTLTDVRDEHTSVWLEHDGSEPHPVQHQMLAWAVTKTLLVRDPVYTQLHTRKLAIFSKAARSYIIQFHE